MFLHLLDDRQKRACIVLASNMVARDAKADPGELGYLRQLIAESGLGAGLGEIRSGEAVDPALFDTPAARFACVAEVLVMSILDGDYDSQEAALANDLVRQFGISASEHEALCRVAEDAAGALAKMRDLVG